MKKLKTHYLVIGYDHHFGNKREGDINLLKKAEKKYPFKLEEIKAHEIEEIKVSSTKIRNAIDNGNIHLFKEYCGRNFEFSGFVVHGEVIGKTINTPTANIKLDDDDKIRPADGVYAVLCQIDNNNLNGIMNIGLKPSININNKKTTIMSIHQLAKQGKHNLFNSMAAGVAARVLDIRKEIIRDSLSDFQNIEHRLEDVAKIHGINFINDSKATNVNSTWYALESMQQPTIWIVGGVDKGNDYSVLEGLVEQKVLGIVCLGKDNSKIKETFG